MLNKCWYGGTVLSDKNYANFTLQEILARDGRPKPEKCRGCGATRTPRWVRRNLGGRGSGCWQWSEVYPHHAVPFVRRRG